MTAREIGRISLAEALGLTTLVAQKAPDRLPRFASRFIRRYIEERPEATVAEVALAGAALQGLTDDRARDACLIALTTLVGNAC